MPWECQRCKAPIATDDVAECPECKAPKSNWTLVKDRTRQFVVARTKFEPWRGDGDATTSLGEPTPPAAVETELLVVLPKAEVRALANERRRPASSALLYVRLYPGKRTDRDVTLTVDYEHLEAKELPPFTPFVDALTEGGFLEVPFVFEYGPEPPLERSPFPGIHLVDLTEDEVRFAPSITAAALKRPPARLAAEPGVPFFLSF